jgi:hypothetical protein
MMFYISTAILQNIFFNGHTNYQLGSGAVINWPHGSESIVLDYGYGSVKNSYGSITLFNYPSVLRTTYRTGGSIPGRIFKEATIRLHNAQKLRQQRIKQPQKNDE